MEKNNTNTAGPSNKGNKMQEPDETAQNIGENDITPLERELLDKAGINESADDDDVLLEEAQLEDLDEDGDKLNEAIDFSGDDLDVPGSELDDANEPIGEEDEENNPYSTRDQDDEREP